MDNSIGGSEIRGDNTGRGCVTLYDYNAVLVSLSGEILSLVQSGIGVPVDSLGVNNLWEYMLGEDTSKSSLVSKKTIENISRDLGEGIIVGSKDSKLAICK